MKGIACSQGITRRRFLACAAISAASLAHPTLFGCAAKTDGGGQDASDVDEMPAPQEEAHPGSSILDELTLEQKVAQLLIVRPEDMLGVHVQESAAEDDRASVSWFDPLTVMDEEVARALAQIPVGGFTFFGSNLESPEQARALIADLDGCVRDACGVPALFCVDEEGGSVARVASNEAFGVTDVGSAVDVGAEGDVDQAHMAAREIAGYLRPLGFNVDFAPVCDVVEDPANSVLAKRSFGGDADLVGEMVAAEVRGFTEAGMACCLKHFPGIGAASGDSHDSLIVIDKTLDELLDTELVPFEAGIKAGAPMVMVGHLALPDITGDGIPATLSSNVVEGILRDRLGFEGVVITDSLGMGAITDSHDAGQAAVAALQAGCDLLLLPSDVQAAHVGVCEAVAAGMLTEERIDESLGRILALKHAFVDGDAGASPF